jgi:hypothetical protein
VNSWRLPRPHGRPILNVKFGPTVVSTTSTGYVYASMVAVLSGRPRAPLPSSFFNSPSPGPRPPPLGRTPRVSPPYSSGGLANHRRSYMDIWTATLRYRRIPAGGALSSPMRQGAGNYCIDFVGQWSPARSARSVASLRLRIASGSSPASRAFLASNARCQSPAAQAASWSCSANDRHEAAK